MTKPAAMDAQITNAKVIGKYLRITLEMPEEARDVFYSCFGWPTISDPVPVALARLNFVPQRTEEEPAKETHSGDQAPAVDTRSPGQLDDLAKHVIIVSESKEFKQWTLDWNLAFPGGVADWVKRNCGVQSRKEITRGSKAEQLWNIIESAFRIDAHP